MSLEELARSLKSELLNPKRFMIVTVLYALGPKTMGDLVRILGLTWGDLDGNVRRLRELGYVRTRKVITLRGPRTLVELTEKGVEEYERLAEKLKHLISIVEERKES